MSTTSYTVEELFDVPVSRSAIASRPALSFAWVPSAPDAAMACSTSTRARSISSLATLNFSSSSRCATMDTSAKPSTPTTSTDTTITEVTTRTCRDVRHERMTRLHAAPIRSPRSRNPSLMRPRYSPVLYPTPRTVSTIRGFSGSCSIFERRRCTWTLTRRVSDEWR